VACEKESFAGVTPVSGTSTSIAAAPTYSGCILKQNGEEKAATVEAGGCEEEFISPEEPSTNIFKTEEAKITGCKGSGITIKSELGSKNCEITVPAQSLGKGVEGKNTKEVAPLGGEGKINFTNRKATGKGCPAKGVLEEEGGLQSDDVALVVIVVVVLIIWS
jgi:hypothetical protein